MYTVVYSSVIHNGMIRIQKYMYIYIIGFRYLLGVVPLGVPKMLSVTLGSSLLKLYMHINIVSFMHKVKEP